MSSHSANKMCLLSNRFEDALSYAAALHREQMRKASCVPYVAHLLAVASLVLEHGADEDEAIAALLHDAIEDQGGCAARDEIQRRFGQRVAAIVSGASDCEVTPKPPWRRRKEAHLEHLATADPSVQLVVAADKLHNARTLLQDYRRLGDELWSHFRGGKAGTLWYYRAALDCLRQGAPAELIAQLDRVLSELESLAGG